MSLANAILLAATMTGVGFTIGYLLCYVLADREMRELRRRNRAQRGENNALIQDNRDLRRDLKRAEQDAEHAALERDAVLDDNLRMHQTLRRHYGKVA